MFDLYLIYVFLLGACLGSFANVVILRLPLGQSLVSPRSHCPYCKKKLGALDLVPIFSWLLLRGKCRSCRAPISFRYSLVELLMALLFLVIYQRYGWSWDSCELMLLSFGLVTVSFIDLDHMILPDVFTLPGVLLGIAGSFLNPSRTPAESLLGVALGGGVLWLMGVLYQWVRKEEGMGGGDVKLLAWIGAVLGFQSLPFVIMVASLGGTLVGVSFILIKKKSLKTAIPFGPYLALGAVLYFLGGRGVGDWYLGLFFP